MGLLPPRWQVLYDEKAGYWVCAYANNQWRLSEEIAASSLEQTSFYRALRLSIGALSILDKDGQCYQRVWCGYEIYVALTQIEGLKYEVYTTSSKIGNGKLEEYAVGITQALTVQSVGASYEAESAEKKGERESEFPLRLAQDAFGVTLETAQASVDSDRAKILNTIAGRPNLSAAPPKKHSSYDKINAMLRGKFALVALRALLDNFRSKPMENFAPIHEAVSLIAGCGLQRLQLSFKGCEAFRDATTMQAIADHLPPDLEELDMEGSGLTNAHAPALAWALGSSKKMTSLNLRANDLGAEGGRALGWALRMSRSLTSLDLSRNQLGAEGGAHIAKALASNTALRTLNVSENGLEAEGAQQLVEALKDNKTLTSLNVGKNGLDEKTQQQLKQAASDRVEVTFY